MRFTTRLMIGETTKTISMEEDDFLFQEEINERVSWTKSVKDFGRRGMKIVTSLSIIVYR